MANGKIQGAGERCGNGRCGLRPRHTAPRARCPRSQETQPAKMGGADSGRGKLRRGQDARAPRRHKPAKMGGADTGRGTLRRGQDARAPRRLSPRKWEVRTPAAPNCAAGKMPALPGGISPRATRAARGVCRGKKRGALGERATLGARASSPRSGPRGARALPVKRLNDQTVKRSNG